MRGFVFVLSKVRVVWGVRPSLVFVALCLRGPRCVWSGVFVIAWSKVRLAWGVCGLCVCVV